jgi:hypothetical protein
MTEKTDPKNGAPAERTDSKSGAPAEKTDSAQKHRSVISRFNDRIADSTASILSSMWLFWLLILIFIVAYKLQPPKGAYENVMFFISAGFQAVALPVLAFVSNIQGDRQEALMNKMQAELMEELDLVKKLVGDGSDTDQS